MKKRWIKVLTVVGACAFLGLAMTVEVYFNQRVDMDKEFFWDRFWNALISQVGRAAMWGCMFPLILQLRIKLPLSRGHWVGGIAFHAGFSFVIMAVYYLGRIATYHVIYHEAWEHFWHEAAVDFYGHNLVDMAWYWGILAFGYSFELYERFRSEEIKAIRLESQLIETELKTLREQLRPHFLFNTMNTVAVLVRENRNDEAITLLSRLGSLLRMSLDPARVHEVTVRQEMEFLERYIEIQKMRFSDRLSVEIKIAPEAMDARIPNLLLQPLVENAIIHGAAPMTGPCRVTVSGRVDGGTLHLEVTDDGPGMPIGGPTRQGVGLSNTRERLTKIYGAAGRFTLESQPGYGVSIFIALPCRL